VALLPPQSPSDDPGSPNRKRFLKKISALATAEDNLGHSPGAKVSAEISAGADADAGHWSVDKDRRACVVKLRTGAVRPEPAAGAGRGVNLDSDEEDMRKLLGDSLDSTEDSLLRRRRSPVKTAGKVERLRRLYVCIQSFFSYNVRFCNRGKQGILGVKGQTILSNTVSFSDCD